MKITPVASRIMRYAGAFLLYCALAGCFGRDLPPPVVKHASHAKTKSPTYDTDAYVLHLSLARLALAQAAPDAAEAAAHLAVLDAYTAAPQTPSTLEPLVVIEYDLKGEHSTQRVLAPFSLSGEGSSFAPLLEIMNRLSQQPAVLRDIRIKVATLSPQPALDLSTQNAAHARAGLDDAQIRLLAQSTAPTPMEETQSYLRLTHFFTEHRMREAAYLSAENAKQSLATLAAKSEVDRPTLDGLSAQLESLEVTLRKTMPFSLNF